MQIEDLREGLFVQNPQRELLRISTIRNVEGNGGVPYVTAQLLMPKPPRTTVRQLTPYHINKLRPASQQSINQMEDEWGLPPLPRKGARA